MLGGDRVQLSQQRQRLALWAMLKKGNELNPESTRVGVMSLKTLGFQYAMLVPWGRMLQISLITVQIQTFAQHHVEHVK